MRIYRWILEVNIWKPLDSIHHSLNIFNLHPPITVMNMICVE